MAFACLFLWAIGRAFLGRREFSGVQTGGKRAACQAADTLLPNESMHVCSAQLDTRASPSSSATRAQPMGRRGRTGLEKKVRRNEHHEWCECRCDDDPGSAEEDVRIPVVVGTHRRKCGPRLTRPHAGQVHIGRPARADIAAHGVCVGSVDASIQPGARTSCPPLLLLALLPLPPFLAMLPEVVQGMAGVAAAQGGWTFILLSIGYQYVERVWPILDGNLWAKP